MRDLDTAAADRAKHRRAPADPAVRTIGFIGNCQTELLHRAFRPLVAAAKIRSFYHFFDIAPADRTQARNELQHCDDLLVQDVRNFDDYPLSDAIRPDTRIIRFPFLWFAAPWPYDDFNGLRDNVARAQDDPSQHTVTYYDGVLGRLRRAIPDPEARLEAYRALDVKGIVAPQKILDFESRRLESQDERYASGIGRYILDHFRDEPLFHTVNRPCGRLLAMLLVDIFTALDLEPPRIAPAELDTLDDIKVPVHPKIAEALDMRWVTPGHRYEVHGREMDWEAYVRAYIARYS